jgi:hypothetical protein
MCLNLWKKRCDHLVFFEALLNETKRVGVKMQKTLSRIKTLGLRNMECSLGTLKENFEQNSVQIALLEQKIKDLKDNEIKLKLRDTKVFEYLHAEKATPLLLDLAKKNSKDTEKLENILDDAGSAFPDDNNRANYIKDYYSGLYLVDNIVTGTIEEFLGPAICEHPLVISSKLTEAERAELDKPLSINELDSALKNANLRSAPGVDGYSYRFIT